MWYKKTNGSLRMRSNWIVSCIRYVGVVHQVILMAESWGRVVYVSERTLANRRTRRYAVYIVSVHDPWWIIDLSCDQKVHTSSSSSSGIALCTRYDAYPESHLLHNLPTSSGTTDTSSLSLLMFRRCSVHACLYCITFLFKLYISSSRISTFRFLSESLYPATERKNPIS